MNGTIRKPLLVLQALLLVFAGIGIGSLTAKLQPQANPGTVPGVAHAGALVVQPTSPLVPVGTGFTYKGRLTNGGNPANGSHDFTFKLYDDPSAGAQVGSTISPTLVLTNGLFTATLDFGAGAFQGDGRWLEIAVRPTGGGGYTTLLPRQPITPAPYALYAQDVQPYDNVVVVAKSGGDFTTVTNALNSIIDNSSTNKYLVWIAPGVYTETVTMKEWVDIEGAGEKVTTISQIGSASSTTGTLIGASNAELRSLTVRNTGGNTFATAIYNSGVGSTTQYLHVTASASGGGSSYGVRNTNSSPNMSNVTASASGGVTNYGVFSFSSSPKIEHSSISASGGANSYGVYNVAPSGSYSVSVDNSTITASTNTIRNDPFFTTSVGASRLSGGAVLPNGGVVTCADVHDENNALLPHNCLNHSANVVEVAKSGLAFTSIQAALNSITNNSASNKYVVRVGPGVYTETVQMKQYVDIEGSGELNTKITFTGTEFPPNTGTVRGASNAELRSLTVENTGGATYAIAIYNDSASPSLLHVTATAYDAIGGTTYSYGVYNSYSSPIMTNVTATASGGNEVNYGVYNFSSSPTMINVTASALSGQLRTNYGVFNDTSSPIMTNVTATASGGPRSANYGVYNGGGSSSPTMTNVTASASGGDTSRGVYNNNSSATMIGVTAIGSGGDETNYGVLNAFSSPKMMNVTASASGESYNRGVHNDRSFPTMTNVTVSASGGITNTGVYNTAPSGTYTVTIDNSTISVPITGTTISNDNNFTTRVGASKLVGGPVVNPAGGVITCAGVHDENYAFFAGPACP